MILVKCLKSKKQQNQSIFWVTILFYLNYLIFREKPLRFKRNALKSELENQLWKQIKSSDNKYLILYEIVGAYSIIFEFLITRKSTKILAFVVSFSMTKAIFPD